jgi:hypothetical protein
MHLGCLDDLHRRTVVGASPLHYKLQICCRSLAAAFPPSPSGKISGCRSPPRGGWKIRCRSQPQRGGAERHPCSCLDGRTDFSKCPAAAGHPPGATPQFRQYMVAGRNGVRFFGCGTRYCFVVAARSPHTYYLRNANCIPPGNRGRVPFLMRKPTDFHLSHLLRRPAGGQRFDGRDFSESLQLWQPPTPIQLIYGSRARYMRSPATHLYGRVDRTPHS